MAEPAVVRAMRSGLLESEHLVDVAVAGADGRLRWMAGEPHRVVFARSSMKPIQAVATLSLTSHDFTDREIAVMCASHTAEPVHLEAVRAILARAGLPESALQTPAVHPRDDAALEESPARSPLNSDCSGKHAGMLAACVEQGWDVATYRLPEHPLQRRILEVVSAAAGRPPEAVGVDGCGVPVHAFPLSAMAALFGRLSAPERWGDLAGPAERVVRAMRAEPYLVAGRGQVVTAIMSSAPGVVAKGGAEGLLCAAVLDPRLGIAVKVRDGSFRAAGPVVLEVLRAVGAVGVEGWAALAPLSRPPLLGGGEPVGSLDAAVSLEEA